MRDVADLPERRARGRAERAFFSALGGDYKFALVSPEPIGGIINPSEAFAIAVRALRSARRGESCAAQLDFEQAYGAFERIGRFDAAAAMLDFVARFALLRGDFTEASTVALREQSLAQYWELREFFSRARHTMLRISAATGEIQTDEVGATFARAAAFLLNVGAVDAQLLYEKRDVTALFELCLRSITDPLDAADLLADIAAFGERQHAHEATMLLEAQAAHDEFKFVGALALLSQSHIAIRDADTARAAARAAEAARRLHEIGAHSFYGRAMDVLTSISTVEPASNRRRDRSGLTRRQRQIVTLLRGGASNREIAKVLHITEHTVESHVGAVLDQLGVHSRWQLLAVSEAD
jgi:DNA-binding CsgD family transcriptional regulator